MRPHATLNYAQFGSNNNYIINVVHSEHNKRSICTERHTVYHRPGLSAQYTAVLLGSSLSTVVRVLDHHSGNTGSIIGDSRSSYNFVRFFFLNQSSREQAKHKYGLWCLGKALDWYVTAMECQPVTESLKRGRGVVKDLQYISTIDCHCCADRLILQCSGYMQSAGTSSRKPGVNPRGEQVLQLYTEHHDCS